MNHKPDNDGIYVFDAYGTLFDVHSAVARHGERVGPNAAQLSRLWRDKQLEYSWTRAGMGKYRDFWTLTTEALDFALQAIDGVNADCRDLLLQAYESLDCYQEVPGTLQALKEAGAKTAILSNGSPDMLQKAVLSAGIGDHLDDVFSVDRVKTFKTMPETYAIVTSAYQCRPGDVTFMSSNRWDIAGATAFGFAGCWINRTGQGDEYHDLQPVRTLPDLSGLLS